MVPSGSPGQQPILPFSQFEAASLLAALDLQHSASTFTTILITWRTWRVLCWGHGQSSPPPAANTSPLCEGSQGHGKGLPGERDLHRLLGSGARLLACPSPILRAADSCRSGKRKKGLLLQRKESLLLSILDSTALCPSLHPPWGSVLPGGRQRSAHINQPCCSPQTNPNASTSVHRKETMDANQSGGCWWLWAPQPWLSYQSATPRDAAGRHSPV